MDLQQLRYFVTVAEHLSFTKAASQLYITQSGLSKHIADLENEFGLQLFIRNKRFVKLTKVGNEILPEARNILEGSEKFLKKIHQTAAGQQSSMKIGFVGLGQHTFLPDLLRKFKSTEPNVELAISQLDWDSLNHSLSKGDIDVAFTLSIGIETLPGVSWESVLPGFLTLALPHDHPFINDKISDLSVLAHEPFVALAHSDSVLSINHLRQLCLEHGFSPKIIKQTPHIQTALLLVELGVGIAVLSTHLEGLAGPKIRFINLDTPHTRQDLIVAWKKDNLNPTIPLFLNELRSFLSDSHKTRITLPQTVNM